MVQDAAKEISALRKITGTIEEKMAFNRSSLIDPSLREISPVIGIMLLVHMGRSVRAILKQIDPWHRVRFLLLLLS